MLLFEMKMETYKYFAMYHKGILFVELPPESSNRDLFKAKTELAHHGIETNAKVYSIRKPNQQFALEKVDIYGSVYPQMTKQKSLLQIINWALPLIAQEEGIRDFGIGARLDSNAVN